MVRQIAHIIVPPREKRSATFRVFTAETTPEEEAERGLLFGCFVIDYYHHRNDEIIDSIIEELQSRYYDPDITTQELEKSLEETLQALNTTLAQLIEHEQIFLNLKRFHGAIGVLKGKTITFTHVGDVRIHLLHHGAGQKQHFIDLLATAENDKEKKSPPITRIFSTLVSGSVRTNDAILFATGSLFDYTTKDRLQKIIGSLPPPRALEQIKSIIKEGKQGIGVLCFLLRLAPDHEAFVQTSAKDSLAALQGTEDDTRGYLAPSLMRNTGKRMVVAMAYAEKTLRALFRIPPTASRKDILRGFFQLLLAAARLVGRVLVLCKRFVVTLAIVAKETTQQGKNWRDVLAQLKTQSQKGMTPMLQKGKQRFAQFTLRQRALIIAAGALAVTVIASTAVIGIQHSRAVKQQEYEKNIALIKERIATAEASLLFKDEERTQSIYQEAQTLIATLPQKSTQQKQTHDALAKEVEQNLEHLRHVIPLASIDVVKDFHDLDPAGEMQTFVIRDTNAYVAHSSRPLIYKVNMENKQALTLDASAVDVEPIQHIAQEEKDGFYLTFGTAGFATLNLERQSVAQTDITFGQAGTRIDAVTVYNKKLYILDTANNQIWRHEKKDNAFEKGVAWLKESVDLAGARAFAIDGALWVVKKDAVVRLLQGKQTSWKLDTFDPPALSLRSVITSQNGNKLWLLDEAGKRVLAVAKDTGKLIAQYPLPAEDIRDFSVNEKTDEIILLTKTKLLKLTYEKQ